MAQIENEKQYEWAVSRVEQLLPLVNDQTPTDDANYTELLLLSKLVEDYSEEHFSLGEPSLSDMIRLRMYELGLTQAGIAKLIGVSQSRVCEYLSGRAEPTLKIGRRISKELNIDPAIVLGV